MAIKGKIVIDGKELIAMYPVQRIIELQGVGVSFESLYQLEERGLSSKDFISSDRMQP